MNENVHQPEEEILPELVENDDKVQKGTAHADNPSSTHAGARSGSAESSAVDGKSGDTLAAQLATEKDKYVRLLAEFDNMRKRQERERVDIIKYAHEEVIIECLNIYDDLERSLAAFKAKEGIDQNLVKGLSMVYKNMSDLMHKYAVKPIEAEGKPFDPNCHEPLLQMETKDVPDGHVMEVLQKGYTLAGRVVRTAKVKVAKNT